MERTKITVDQAAELLGISSQLLRIHLKKGTIPIGTAFPPEGCKTHWMYYISPTKLMQYTGLRKEAIERACGVDLSGYQEPVFQASDPQVIEMLKALSDQLGVTA